MYHERVADNFVQKNSSLANITVSMKVAYYFFKRKLVRQYVFTGVALENTFINVSFMNVFYYDIVI